MSRQENSVSQKLAPISSQKNQDDEQQSSSDSITTSSPIKTTMLDIVENNKSFTKTSLSKYTSISNVKEKEQLQSLNNRLVLIIQKVRQLEEENAILREKVIFHEESEQELKRQRIDLVRDKALLEIELIEQKARAELAIQRRNSILQEYQELCVAKSDLDDEISLYEKILQHEETSSNISISDSPLATTINDSAIKSRKRPFQSD